MSDTMDSMLAALGQAGYSPREDGGLMAELAAYDAVLAPLLQATDHVLQGLFIETADATQLEKWEKLFCPQSGLFKSVGHNADNQMPLCVFSTPVRQIFV